MNKIKNTIMKLNTISLFKKWILLLLVLILTLSIRIYVNYNYESDYRHNYGKNFEPALFYLAGEGMYFASKDDSDARKKIDEFLNEKSESLDIKILKKFIEQEPEYRVGFKYQTFGYYTAAYVWKIFGISWSNLYYFYSFLSTLACLAIFLTLKKITNSYLGGILGSLTYALATPEFYGMAWSIRDASPVWFFSFSIMFLFVFTGIYKNRWLNYGSYYLLGLVTLVGIGWRPDVLMFLPFIFISLLAVLIFKKKESFKNIFLYLILFLLGSFTMIHMESYLKANNVSPLGFMHVAHYAEDRRSKIGNYENNFQNRVLDAMTQKQVRYYKEGTYPNDEQVVNMRGKYGKYCLELYLNQTKHNLYQWVVSYPEYLGVFLFNHTTIDKKFYKQNQEIYIKLIWKFLVITGIIGGVLLLIFGIFRLEVSLIFGFIFYYSVVYWSIYPNIKHIMIMSVPISILSGMVLYTGYSLLFSSQYRNHFVLKFKFIRTLKSILYGICSVLIVYLIALFVSSIISKNMKTEIIKEINHISKNEKHVLNIPYKQTKNSFFIDLKNQESVGVLIDFTTNGKENIVEVKHEYGTKKTTQAEYKYVAEKKINKHTLFTTIYKLDNKHKVNIEFESGVKITNVKILSLKSWNGIYYTTIFNQFENSSGSKKLPTKQHPSIYRVVK